MATLTVVIAIEGEPEVTAVLSTDHAASSYGVPVLLLDTGQEGEGALPHGPADVTPWGVPAGALNLFLPDRQPDGWHAEDPRALERLVLGWMDACRAFYAPPGGVQ